MGQVTDRMRRFYRTAHMRLNIPPLVKRSYYDFADLHLEGCKTFMDNEILKCASFTALYLSGTIEM